ncbi:MAG TPA: N-acetyl-gamma-glutamyl-phosphate reductase [Ferruginibacter sp.]|nr:N-acetyl-gamma-glutamyl-phosphate reductase [Ferruginibacter sp.]HMP20379.1 N-acetyl-gamma-glutamyl-phosphate reductase [Ferruginibacter sp.]
MATKIKAGIIGGAGYTGGELIRLLVNHPLVEIAFINSKSNAGNPVHKVHADLLGETDLVFNDDLTALKDGSVDVIFLCLGHGDARKFLDANPVHEKIKIIDLSNDFRLKEKSTHSGRQFVYGLPELNRDVIKAAQNIANPGCFATAIQLGLLPLAQAGLLNDIYTTGITGSTGAGQGLSETSHFSWRVNNIQAYKTLTHQHLGEIGQSLLQLQAAGNIDLNFVPWRGDFSRGIFISSQLNSELDAAELEALYSSFYADAPFTTVTSSPVFLKQVVNTNKCIIQLEKVGSKLVVHSVIDNLLKGASGQAVQNMNLLFGLDETAGLRLKANYF